MRTGGEKMNLKVLRKRKGFSQQYMANQLNIAISTYNQYENNNRKIPIDKAKGIAEILNININDIFSPVWFTIREQE